MEYHFDYDELRETAEVVLKINPSTDGWTVNDMVQRMEDDARRTLHEPKGYLSTYGYVLTAFPYLDTGKIGIKASVNSYTIASYLGRKGL